jgi:lantibiotic modifying enzyme
MWEPIIDADASRDCWSTIADIERALVEDSPNDGYVNPGIAGGDAGVALFFAYLHAAAGNEAAADFAFETLDRSMSALSEHRLLPTLYSGFFGIGWVVSHLTRELFESDGDVAGEIDDALRQLLAEAEERPPFELIGGLAGYGTYLVERLPDPGAAELLTRIIDRLDATRDASGTWYSHADWLPDWQRELMPRGCYNLGVAHGIPGVIGMLAAARREGFDDARLPRLADDAVRWMLDQKTLSMPSSVFPSHVPPDDDPRETRTAWCYGDLGIAAVLLSAAQSFGREDWREEALDIARIAARRPFEDTKANDVGLCHGAAGVAHLFNRIHQATGESELRDAARAWYRRALDMRRPGEGVAGYLSWIMDPPNEGVWRGERGFLSGVAGVGLALLAAVTNVEPAWDRVMLVAVPPRNGETVQ